jgi:ribosomal protein L37AE/L43A
MADEIGDDGRLSRTCEKCGKEGVPVRRLDENWLCRECWEQTADLMELPKEERVW